MKLRYAMVLNKRVIDLVESESKPEYPPDIEGNPVFAIQCGEEIKVGMIYNESTESFEEYVPPEPEPTQLDRMEAALLKSQDEIRQEGADSVMEELVKRGLIV